MSDPPAPSDAESADFRALGLTPGNWATLAPVPLLLPGVRTATAADFDHFRELAALVPGSVELADECGNFWSRYAQFRPPAAALALLGWHLAKRVPLPDREAYLEGLARAAERFFPGEMMRPDVVGPVREAVEAALGQTEYQTHPSPVAEPPEPVPPPPLPEPQPEAVTPLYPPATVGAELAREFTPLTLREALRQARRTTVVQVRAWWAEQGHAGTLLFDGHRDECREVAIVREPRHVPEHLWVVGDVHADVLSLANLVAFARRESGDAAFVFLGDFIDRGPLDHETLLFLFGLVMGDERSVCIIPGNHDTDLRWSEKAGRFAVTIQPAEYCDRLNALLGSERREDREQVELAKLAIEFWRTRPKAVFLPDGTMLAHGGFPHTDLQVGLRAVGQLGEPDAVSDFLWARLSESPKKRPNRHGNRGHEFGWRDFAQFCRVMTEHVGVPVRRLVRGHDHVAARWQLAPDYVEHGYPVLTLNAMGWRMDGEPEPPDGPHPFPVIARHVPDRVPLVFRVPPDPAEVDRAFAPEPEPDFIPEILASPIEVEPHAPPPPTRPVTDAELEGGG